MSKRGKKIEFVILLISSVVLIGILIKSHSSSELQEISILDKYECELWKSSSLIYTHRVTLSNGKHFFIRTKMISCDDVQFPEEGKPVTIYSKGDKLLGVEQNGKEILNRQLLKQSSDNSSSIVEILTVFIVLMTFWSWWRYRQSERL